MVVTIPLLALPKLGHQFERRRELRMPYFDKNYAKKATCPVLALLYYVSLA